MTQQDRVKLKIPSWNNVIIFHIILNKVKLFSMIQTVWQLMANKIYVIVWESIVLDAILVVKVVVVQNVEINVGLIDSGFIKSLNMRVAVMLLKWKTIAKWYIFL